MDLGTVGKIRIISYFIEKGYDVFIEVDGKSPFDIVVHKEGLLERVEIKTTSTRCRSKRGWVVQLKKVRSNKNRNKITSFNPNQCDLVAIYIRPKDKVVILKSKEIEAKSTINVYTEE